MQEYKTIIFDLDMTLIESYKVSVSIHQAVLDKHYPDKRIDVPVRAKELWGLPQSQYWLELFDRSEEHLEVLRDQIIEEAKSIRFRAFPGAVDAVMRLQKHFRIGLLTASSTRQVNKALSEIGLGTHSFEYIQSEEVTEFHKPDPRVFEPLLSFFNDVGVKNREILYVGDAVRDFHAAKGAGVGFKGVLTGFVSRQEFLKNGVQYEDIINSVTDLPDSLNVNQRSDV